MTQLFLLLSHVLLLLLLLMVNLWIVLLVQMLFFDLRMIYSKRLDPLSGRIFLLMVYHTVMHIIVMPCCRYFTTYNQIQLFCVILTLYLISRFPLKFSLSLTLLGTALVYRPLILVCMETIPSSHRNFWFVRTLVPHRSASYLQIVLLCLHWKLFSIMLMILTIIYESLLPLSIHFHNAVLP